MPSHDTTFLLSFLVLRNFLQLIAWVHHVAHFVIIFFYSLSNSWIFFLDFFFLYNCFYLFFSWLLSWLGKTAKSLSIFLFFFFSFILDLLHRRKCGKVSHHKCHTNTVTWQEVTASHHMMSHDESHDRHGEIVHRPCSSCISSIENLTRTPSSFPCQTLIKEQLA